MEEAENQHNIQTLSNDGEEQRGFNIEKKKEYGGADNY